MRKVSWGRCHIGREKVYSLIYADDMVLLVEEERKMRSMMERLERFLDENRLNAAKTKVMRLRKEEDGEKWSGRKERGWRR